MDDTQVNHIKAQLSAAIDSGDVKQMVSAIAISLVSSVECQAHANSRTKEITEAVNALKDRIRPLEPLESRMSKLEARVEDMEREKLAEANQRKGAGKTINFLVAAGLVGGGAVASNLPQILKALAAALSGG